MFEPIICPHCRAILKTLDQDHGEQRRCGCCQGLLIVPNSRWADSPPPETNGVALTPVPQSERGPGQSSLRSLANAIAISLAIIVLFCIFIPLNQVSTGGSRNSRCRAELQQIGIAMLEFADEHPRAALTSGGFDLRDGCPDSFGWVADVTRRGLQHEKVCSSNPYRMSETVNAMVIHELDQLADNYSLARLHSGVCGSDSYEGIRGTNNQGTFANTTANSQRRAEIVARAMMQHGYNTNYATSWFLTNSMPRTRIVTTAGEQRVLLVKSDATNWRDRRATLEPLSLQLLAESHVPSARIPLLADAAPTRGSNSLVGTTIGFGPDIARLNSPSGMNSPRSINTSIYATRGTQLASNGNPGPKLGLTQNSLDLTEQLQHDLIASPNAMNNKEMYRQDTSGWAAVHGVRQNELVCNVLMADGSITKFANVQGNECLDSVFSHQSSEHADETVRATSGQDLQWLVLARRRCR